jgi:hypothetical protein
MPAADVVLGAVAAWTTCIHLGSAVTVLARTTRAVFQRH